MPSAALSFPHATRAARMTIATTLGLLVGLWVVNMGRVVHAAVETPTRAANASHVVVLGKRLSSGVVDRDFHARLERAASIMAADPRRMLVISGGGAGTSEAAAGLQALQANVATALDPARIAIEQASTSTRENLRNIRRMIPQNTRPIIISSRYHMARISRLAAQASMPVHLVAAEPVVSFSLASTGHMIKEAAYLTVLDINALM